MVAFRVAGTRASASSYGYGISVPVPSTAVVGDLLIMHVTGLAASGNTWTGAGAGVSGWNQLRSDTHASDSRRGQAVFWKIAASGDAGSSASLSCSNAWVQAIVLAYSSPASSPIKASGFASASATSVTAPSVSGTGIPLCLFGDTSSSQTYSTWTMSAGTSRYNIAWASGTVGSLAAEDGANGVTGTVGQGSQPMATTVILTTNSAPNAPTLNSPANNATIDRGITQRFAWTFSDPDAGDSQSKYDLRYRVVGTTTWTTVSGTTPNAFRDFTASTFAAGNYEWQVETYDSQGVVGAWSSSSFFTAADAPPAPTITAPVNGSTVTSSATVTWSTPNQTDYEVRRVADNAGSANTSTVYFDTGDVIDSTTRSITVAFDTNTRWEHVQVREKYNGLWSSWADTRVQVSFTQPPTPTRVLTADSTAATITVAITNPTPSGSQPAVAYNDVYIDDQDGNGWVRKATNLATNTTWTYRLPRSGVDYEPSIVVVAVATNGVTSQSGPMA